MIIMISKKLFEEKKLFFFFKKREGASARLDADVQPRSSERGTTEREPSIYVLCVASENDREKEKVVSVHFSPGRVASPAAR